MGREGGYSGSTDRGGSLSSRSRDASSGLGRGSGFFSRYRKGYRSFMSHFSDESSRAMMTQPGMAGFAGYGGRGTESVKRVPKGTPPQKATAPATIGAQQQSLSAEEESQRLAAAKRRRYLARRGL